MGLFNFFKKEEREFSTTNSNQDDLTKILEGSTKTSAITRDMAMQIPSLKAGIGFIADLVSSLEIKLHKVNDGKVETVADDYRLKLLNDETGDTLNSYQMKQSLVRDFIIAGNGYVYLNKDRNRIISIHYVEPSRVSVTPSIDPIFKDGKLIVNGVLYNNYDFIIFAKNTVNGLSGKGLLDENSDILELAYNTLAFANSNIKAGGIKRGVVKSSKKLEKDAIDYLKSSWAELYDTNNSKNKVIILNDSLDFKELSQTSIELQILENRKTNNEDILNLIKMPLSILNGTATEQQYNNFIKSTIVPILAQLESAFNTALLLETEKSDGYFFAFSVKDLLKGNTLERFNTYKAAIDSGVMTINECRYQENLDPIPNMDILKMSLGNIIYNIETGETYVPNTGQVIGDKGIQDTSEKEVNTDGSKET